MGSYTARFSRHGLLTTRSRLLRMERIEERQMLSVKDIQGGHPTNGVHLRLLAHLAGTRCHEIIYASNRSQDFYWLVALIGHIFCKISKHMLSVKIRYSLTGMMLATTFVSLPLAWIGCQRRDFLAEVSAANTLAMRYNATAYTFAETSDTQGQSQDPVWDLDAALLGRLYHPLTVIYFAGAALDDEVAQLLENLRYLEFVQVQDCQTTSAKFIAPDTCRHLEVLAIFDTRVSSKQLSAIASSSTLKSLTLSGTGIDDDDMQVIGKMCDLESLDFARNRVTDLGVSRITQLKRLKTLVIGDTDCSGEVTAILSKLDRLETLGLYGLPIDDRSLLNLCKLKSLKSLDLSRTNITDAGVRQLACLRGLTELDLSGTSITNDCVGALLDIGFRKRHQLTVLDTGLTSKALKVIDQHFDCQETVGDQPIDGNCEEADSGRLPE